MQKNTWGFDVKALDRAVRPQDDLFRYVNGNWLKQNPIPLSESRWGAFIALRHDTDKSLHALVKEVTTKKSRGHEEHLIADLYRSGMDMKRRNAAGAKPLEPVMKRIDAMKDSSDVVPTVAYLHTIGVDAPFGAGVDQDLKRSTHYILYLGQSGLGMPDRDYYLKNTPEERRVRKAYRKHAVRIFALLGCSSSVAAVRAETVMRVETALAKASMDKVSLRDPHKIYHKKSYRELLKLAPGIAWKQYFSGIGLKVPAQVIVTQPDFAKRVGRMIRELPLSDWKIYLAWHVANDSAALLSQKFIDENFAFYGRTLGGSKELKPLWRRVLGTVNGCVGEALGKIYVKRHFTLRAKRKMDELVNQLFVAYEKRIRGLDWMSPGTKRKALVKLRAINRKIGYPSRWRSYRGLVFKADDFFGNILRTEVREHKRAMKRVGRGVRRHEWFMTPQTVNAYYTPTLNEIVFPAAILQPPFFDPSADDALNYGAIGAVIGHEITHGFDDEGSKFGADGNLNRWWGDRDRALFDEKGVVLVRQYGGFEVAPGIKVNGKLTLGENIADLGGASIAFDAYLHHLGKTGRKLVGGFTPEQRFFLGWARADREHARPEYMKTAAAVDPHSPSVYRINGPASNMNEFYTAFGVRRGDRLYREPGDRAKIW